MKDRKEALAQEVQGLALKPGAKLEIQRDFGFFEKGDIATVTQVRKSPEGHLVVQLRTETGKIESLKIDPRNGSAETGNMRTISLKP